MLRKQPPGKTVKYWNKRLTKKKKGVRSNATAHRLDREFKVLQCLEKVNFPAPKAIAYCGDEKVLGNLIKKLFTTIIMLMLVI